jgi:ABC-type multidrug transport system permease subunit
MKVLYIAISNLKDFIRDIRSNAIIFILPIVFIGIFGVIFSQDFSDIDFRVAVLEDQYEKYESMEGDLQGREPVKLEVSYNQILNILEEQIDKDSDSSVEISKFEDRETAIESLKEKENHMLIELTDENIVLYRDSGNYASQALEAIVTEVVNPSDSALKKETIAVSDDFTQFELQASGLIVYGILILIAQSAGYLAFLTQSGRIFRYFVANVTSWEILGGFLISQTVIAAFQTIVLVLTSGFFAENFSNELLSVFLFTIPLNFFAIGVGLLIGAFAEKTTTAENTASLVSIILGFLSGSFIVGLENIKFIGDYSVVHFVPSFYATEGIRKMLLFGLGLEEVLTELAIITIAGTILFISGVIVYSRKRLQIVDK